MLTDLRSRLAAAMAAFRRRPLAPPAPPDMSALTASMERLKADALAMQARAEAMRDALAKAGRG